MKPCILIRLDDLGYAKALAAALNRIREFPYEVAVEDPEEPDAETALQPVLLISERTKTSSYGSPSVPVLYLSDSSEDTGDLLRYQPLRTLVPELRRRADSLITERKLRTRVRERAAEYEDLKNPELLKLIDGTISELQAEDAPVSEPSELRRKVFSSMRELDRLTLIMEDPEVTEIMVNGDGRIFVEREGRLSRHPERFESEEDLMAVIRKIAALQNKRVSRTSPILDVRLTDGSRVNVVLPPVSCDGPVVTVRRFSDTPMSLSWLRERGSITDPEAEYLKRAVRERKNIFISGGTGAGKTTFLSALSSCIPKDERVVTIEDTAELRLSGVENLVRLEARPANMEGEYEVTIRDLIRTSLRMRPDRIIVGEIRGAEAIDMLQAMNTGHAGSMSTGHSNSAADMISRIETMVLLGCGDGGLSLYAVRTQIVHAIDIIVHLVRDADGRRRVEGIYEVSGISEGEAVLQKVSEQDASREAEPVSYGGSDSFGGRHASDVETLL